MTPQDQPGPATSALQRQFTAAWRTVVPLRGDPYGPLPPLMLLLTFVTGLVDAFSYLELGRVFVANMTGNVVFLAFTLGGAPGFIWWGALLGIVSFSLGALIGGRIAHRFSQHRAKQLLIAAGSQTVLFVLALLAALLLPLPYGDLALVVLILLLGIGMGLQNAIARALAVPDLTTTVLTLTITGISADGAAAGGTNSKVGRRLLSVACMFLGALCAAVLILAVHPASALILAVLVLLAVTAVAWRFRHSTAGWTGN